jgi:hypothetical protein
LLNRLETALITAILLFTVSSTLTVPNRITLECTLTIKGNSPMTLTWLHVDGAKIRNATNGEVHLRGVALGGLGESGLTYWNGGHSQLVTQINGIHTLLPNCNVIRCMTACSNPDGTGFNNPTAFDTAIDDLVALCTPLGIRVIIEFHGGLNVTAFSAMIADPSQLVSWFQHFASRYASNPTVAGFEVYNEPSMDYTDSAGWAAINQQVINAVAAINPYALLICCGIPYGGYSSPTKQGITYYTTNPLTGNVAYGWDTYYCNAGNYWKTEYSTGDWAGGKTKTETFINTYCIGAAIIAGLPIICTETGWYGNAAPAYPADLNEAGWSHQMTDWFGYLNAQGTNWYCFWWWSNPDNLGLATNDTYSALSPQGIVLSSVMPSSTPTHDLTINSTAGGTTNPTAGVHTYDEDTVVSVSASASAGYYFVSWTRDGTSGITGATIDITMDAAHTLVPVFGLATNNTQTLDSAVYVVTMPASFGDRKSVV